MPIDKPELETLDYKAQPKPNDPIVIISVIEGLAEQISENIHALSNIKNVPIDTAVAIANAWSSLDKLRTKEIHNLRKVFE